MRCDVSTPGTVHAMGQRRPDRLAPHLRGADARVHRHPLPPGVQARQPPSAPLDGDGQPGRGRPQLEVQARDARVRRRGAPAHGPARRRIPRAPRARGDRLRRRVPVRRDQPQLRVPIRPGGEQEGRRDVLRGGAHAGPGARGRVPQTHARGRGRPGHREAQARREAHGKVRRRLDGFVRIRQRLRRRRESVVWG